MFAPCVACRRHVRTDASACPFCGGTVAAQPAPRTFSRPTRAAILFASAASLAGCGDSVAMYGAPAPTDAAVTDAADAAGDTGATTDTAVVAPYGAPSTPALV